MGDTYTVTLKHVLDLRENISLDGESFVRAEEPQSCSIHDERGLLSAYNPYANEIVMWSKQLSERVSLDPSPMTQAEAGAYKASIIVGHEVSGHVKFDEIEPLNTLHTRVKMPLKWLRQGARGLELDRTEFFFSALLSGKMLVQRKLTHELFAYSRFSRYVRMLNLPKVSIHANADLDSVTSNRDEHAAAVTILKGAYGKAAEDYLQNYCIPLSSVVYQSKQRLEVNPSPVTDDITIEALNQLKTGTGLDPVKFKEGILDQRTKRLQQLSRQLSDLNPVALRSKNHIAVLDKRGDPVALSEKELRDHAQDQLENVQDVVQRRTKSRLMAGAMPLLRDRLTLIVVDEEGNASQARYFKASSLKENSGSVKMALEQMKLIDVVVWGISRILGAMKPTYELDNIIAAAKAGTRLPLPPDPDYPPFGIARGILEEVEERSRPFLRRINRMLEGRGKSLG